LVAKRREAFDLDDLVHEFASDPREAPDAGLMSHLVAVQALHPEAGVHFEDRLRVAVEHGLAVGGREGWLVERFRAAEPIRR
jgi:hypothetical protein